MAATEVIFHEKAPAAAQRLAQVGAEILPELGTRGAVGARHFFPDARSGRVERARVHVFLFHFLKCAFQTVFGHRRTPFPGGPKGPPSSFETRS